MQPQDDSKQREVNPLLYLFAKVWWYSVGNRHKIVWYWIMFIVASTISLVVYPLVVRAIINVAQDQGATSANIYFLYALLAALFVTKMVFWSLHGPARLMENANAFLARANYRKFLLKNIMILQMEWHVDHHSGDTIDKVEKGANGLYDFSKNSFELIYMAVQMVISYGMLIWFCPSASYIVFGITLIAAWIVLRFDRLLVVQYRQLNHYENSISESVFDAISNISTVIILRVERLVFESIVHKIDKPLELFKSNSRLNEIKWFLVSVCYNAMVSLVLAAYFWNALGASEGILIGNLYILFQYLERVGETFFDFARMYGDILQRKSRVNNSEELTRDFKSENFTNHVLPKNWQQLEIRGLNFSYHNGNGTDLHLIDIFLTLERGSPIALIGKSGSGKTTLLKVMRDLYHLQSMTLLVDGNLISGFDGISRAIALVPQNPEIFATTILDNITLGAEYEPTFVQQFTDMACFTDVVMELPRGLDSSIKEKGVNLSGGQQQRLALARGLLACHDKDIVLLDEPTSSLDIGYEMQIYENIFRAFSEKTIISSIHRLHLLPLFHHICFMDDGRIVASGSLDELLQKCPQFQALWQQYHAAGQETVM